jgi:hypothetical protein
VIAVVDTPADKPHQQSLAFCPGTALGQITLKLMLTASVAVSEESASARIIS